MFTLPVDLYSPIIRIAVAAAVCMAIDSTLAQASSRNEGLTLRLPLVITSALLIEELACLRHRKGNLQD